MYMSSVFYGTIYIRKNRLLAFANFESKLRKDGDSERDNPEEWDGKSPE